MIWCGGSVVVTVDDDTVLQEEHENEQHRKVVFVLSNRGLLYRSIDYGFKWENVSESLGLRFDLPEDVSKRHL